MSARARSLLSVDDLPFWVGLLVFLLLMLLWHLQHGEHNVCPLSGAAALGLLLLPLLGELLLLSLLLLLLLVKLQTLMDLACLLVATARRLLSAWLAAATAALEPHGDGLNCAVLRGYHGDFWKTTAGLLDYCLAAGLHQKWLWRITVVIVVACRCLSWSSLSLLWLANTGVGDSITLLASPLWITSLCMHVMDFPEMGGGAARRNAMENVINY